MSHITASKKRTPAKVWVGVFAIGLVLLVMPFLLGATAGQGWIRILNFALLYVMLALGLNIVVGFAGLLDLGYIAFYAVGAYVWALLASPHFNLHLPFWVILPVGIALAAMAGIALGFPVLKLRGDYLAIVTLGFGEIIRIFMNNLDAPVNITNGPQGINRIDTIKIGEWALGRPETILGFRITGPEKYYYVLMALVLLIIFICIRLQNSRVGRAWEAVREDEIAAKAMGIREVKIVFKHILPNVISLLLVSMTLDFATCMLTESTLSYLGFGIPLPTPTWGNLLTGANNSIVIQQYWWRWVFPAAIFGLCTVCINLMGDGLRDAVDPKSNER